MYVYCKIYIIRFLKQFPKAILDITFIMIDKIVNKFYFSFLSSKKQFIQIIIFMRHTNILFICVVPECVGKFFHIILYKII